MRIAAGDVAYLDDLQVRLSRAIAAAATTGGATYVDTWSASAGRDACAPPDRRWVEPMVGARTHHGASTPQVSGGSPTPLPLRCGEMARQPDSCLSRLGVCRVTLPHWTS